MSKDVYIHAGAHRTGTSSLQLCLAANRAVLHGAGFDLAYPGRDGIPDAQLKLGLPRGGVGAHRLPGFAKGMRDHLQTISPDEGRSLILSEENIPGPMKHFYQGQFFPFAKNRLSALSQVFSTRPKHVLYVIRRYDELFVSAYRKRAEDNAVPPFSELVPNFLNIAEAWPRLITEIRDTLNPEILTVIEYKARGDSIGLLNRLVPRVSGLALTEPEHSVNLSATDAALEVLQARYRAGKKFRRPKWKAVIAEHADQREPRGFAEFSSADQDVLHKKYQRDLAQIAEMEGLTFVSR
ncbi:MAG: hypothetical protein GJ676_14795 [Rhodobacteraceae bacterium]|nr:hypothetical protein [Paracoccaceae bacterium]